MSGITVDQLGAAAIATVYTADGRELGELEGLWYVEATREVQWLKVRRGILGVRHAVVPAERVELRADGIHLPYTADDVGTAPDASDDIDRDSEHRLATHYDVAVVDRHEPLQWASIEPVDEEAEIQRW